MHEEDEADDVGDEVENGGAVERIGGSVDICILHFRASSAFFHRRIYRRIDVELSGQ